MKRNMVFGELMSIKAFVFDFDGLIIDTESPKFEAWQTVFGQYGLGLPLSEWQKALGTSKLAFYPPNYLEELVGHAINKKKADHDQKVIALSKILQLKILPGVEKLLGEAKERGIKMAVASSSSTDWVWCNLSRLGLLKYFDTICSGDEVPAVKPDPTLFQLAISELDVQPEEAIVFEDSPNGITAANNAGIFCVAIPNFVSEQLNIEHANLILNSLEEITLDELLAAPGKNKEER
jgi:putative hydrolase of the HAD superfamily